MQIYINNGEAVEIKEFFWLKLLYLTRLLHVYNHSLRQPMGTQPIKVDQERFYIFLGFFQWSQ